MTWGPRASNPGNSSSSSLPGGKGGVRQGLQPCTCLKPEQRQRQKLAIRGMAGWVRLRGTP
ncbi:hypothetical protein C1925_15035 [Stenotrophomonas sp. SAU14A_NAIMI4_5]|nr:hypothetical protein C1925_15035 [Stenotrophomonas sp. SAU14A_NAIMI4_5]